MDRPVKEIKYVVLREDIAQGQRVESFRIVAETKSGGQYPLYQGTCIGNKKICQLQDPFADQNSLHIQLSREAASEGMVLLKNEAKVLPFAKGTRLALFGKGTIDYVKGGGGSGDVTCAYVRSLQDGLICKAKEGKVQLLPSTEDFYRKSKEVVQLYYSACQGILGKPLKALGAFAKTRLLSCGESQVLRLKLPVEDMASYDDLGKISKSAYVLEAGDYIFWIGNSVRNVTLLNFVFTVKDTVITRQLSEKCAPTKLARRMLSDGSYEKLPEKETTFEKNGLVPQPLSSLEGVEPQVRAVDYRVRGKQKGVLRLEDVALGKTRLDPFLEQLTDFQTVQLLSGQPNMGVADTYGMGNLMEYGVPNIMTADGPAGLRIDASRGVYTTAWPCAALLACTWNTALVKKVGTAGAAEVKENNIGIWLTPAMNIHRSPLCGRNFEYAMAHCFSEQEEEECDC